VCLGLGSFGGLVLPLLVFGLDGVRSLDCVCVGVLWPRQHSYTMTNRELRNAKAAGVHLTAGVQDPPSTAAETPETAAPETAENSDSEEEVGGRPTTPAPARSNGTTNGTTNGDAVAQHTRSHDAAAAASNRRVETLANVRDSGVDTSSDEAAVVHSQAYLHAVAQYPANATLRNWVYFTYVVVWSGCWQSGMANTLCCNPRLVPTVCYEPEYPRSPSFRIRYFLEKVPCMRGGTAYLWGHGLDAWLCGTPRCSWLPRW